MTNEELLRYSRHIFLPEIDIEGQQALLEAHVVVVGAGGLGSPVIQYLAAAGIGHLTLVDDDHVELSNLQRQTIHQMQNIDQPKVASAADSCRQLNPQIKISTYQVRCQLDWLQQTFRDDKISVMVDCTDNADIRYDLNRYCLDQKIPWVSAAAIALSGQLLVIDPRQEDSPCYRCLYPELDSQQLNCAETGVLSPVVGLIGCSEAIEVIRLIAPFGQPQHGRLKTYEARTGDWRHWQLKRRLDCSDCGKDKLDD